MMRSLYSAVSGLKTHQTRMDVIGNNIANVNTEAFKSSSVTFSEIMYQTTSRASGGDVARGIGGVNAKQIGLGVSMATTTVSIESAGAAETTGNPFDLKLTDSQSTNFFIVSDGTSTKFTRAGSFYVDGNGYLCMASTGYTLMGWQVDDETGAVRKDTVSALQVMSAGNQVSAPEATTKAYVSGVLDKNDTDLQSTDGYVMTVGFFDALGYSYTAKFGATPALNAAGEAVEGQYTISLKDIVNSEGTSIIKKEDKNSPSGFKYLVDPEALFVPTTVQYDTNDGKFISIGDPDSTNGHNAYLLDENGEPYQPENPGPDDWIEAATGYALDKNAVMLDLSILDAARQADADGDMVITATDGDTIRGNNNYPVSNFSNITINFSLSMNYNNGGVSSMKMLKGDSADGSGTGKKLGKLTGLTVDNSGRIYGSYDNGNTELLCQISVAQFANASGLEKVGENCYQTTLNSGEFDGIGVEISNDGSKISTGELEMSNVDLSGEFTSMIVTQRGFQANSRVITTSDTLLEELINLKR